MKLPVLETVTAAYAALLTRPAQFIVAMIPALVLLLALWGLLLGRVMMMQPWSDYRLVWIAWGLDALPYAAFGLIWLRVLLYAPKTGLLPRPLFGPGSSACFGWTTLFSLVVNWQFTMSLPAVARVLETGRTGQLGVPAVLALTVIVLPAVSLGSVYLVARCSLLPVAAAGDATLSLAAAWCATRGNGARIAAAYLLAGLPAAIAAGILKATYLDAARSVTSGFREVVISIDSREIVIGKMIAAPLRIAAAALIAAVAVESYQRLVDRGSRHFHMRPRFD